MNLVRTVVFLVVGVLSASVLAQSASAQKSDAPRPTFEAASVKQNMTRGGPVSVQPGGRLTATGTPLVQLILFAFDLTPVQLVGAPDWASTDRFDIVATAGHDARSDEIRLMLQSLLEDRFHLTLRKEQREMPIHELVIARADGRLGPMLIQVSSQEHDCPAAAPKFPPRAATGTGTAHALACGPISQLARAAFPAVQTAVIDKTGLTGTWYWSLYFDASMLPDTPDFARVNVDPNLPSMPTAFEEQLGLKLRSTRGPVDVVVIDHIEHPTEN